MQFDEPWALFLAEMWTAFEEEWRRWLDWWNGGSVYEGDQPAAKRERQ
jgi:hypothetical protein